MDNSRFRREYTISEVLSFLGSKLRVILAVALLATIVTGLVTAFLIQPKYRAYTTMYVYTNIEANQTGILNNSDLQAAENLASTYKIILQSNQITTAVADQIHKTYQKDASLRNAKIKINTIPDTQLLSVEVVSADPKLASAIADAYANVAPEEIIRVTKAGGVEIVDYAQEPTSPYSPRLALNCAFALVVGALLTALFLLARLFSDTTIYTEEEIHSCSQLPILAEVPDIIPVKGTAEQAALWKIKGVRRISNVGK